jgi:hypothetical protein
MKLALIAALLLTGCAGRRVYVSTDNHCDDGCWTLEPAPQIGPQAWAWCRREGQTLTCVPQR